MIAVYCFTKPQSSLLVGCFLGFHDELCLGVHEVGIIDTAGTLFLRCMSVSFSSPILTFY